MRISDWSSDVCSSDLATQALRQPGSAFKTFVYLAGAEAGIYLDDRYVDGPLSIGGWSPGNYNDRYSGDVTVREAFARSLHSLAVPVEAPVRAGAGDAVPARVGVRPVLGRAPTIARGAAHVTPRADAQNVE